MFLSRPALAAVVASATIAGSAFSALIAGWTMPTAFPTGTGNVPTGVTYLPPGPNGAGVADQGANTAGSQLRAVHSLAAATYTSPAGNGSPYSFSSNNWVPNDFYEVRLSTTGYTGISVSWDQARSSTGPSAFKVSVSFDGGMSFSDVFTYAVLQSGGGGAPGTWSSTTANSLYSNSLNLAAGADDASLLVIRFVNAEAANSSASGSNRIDNILVNGTAVPAPGAVALLGVAGLAASRRRRA